MQTVEILRRIRYKTRRSWSVIARINLVTIPGAIVVAGPAMTCLRSRGHRKVRFVVAENPVFRDYGGVNELLSNWVLIARVSKDCERTHVTVNGEMLAKVIDQHDVAARIAKL